MQAAFLLIYIWYQRLLIVAAIIAGTATFVVMWLVDASALSRKVFNAPINGSVEITQSLMVVSVMLALAYAQSRGSHLRVVILVDRLPRPVASALYTISLLIAFAFFAVVTTATFWFALRSYRIDEHVWGAMVRFPVYPAKGIICLGSLLLSIQFLLDAIRFGVFGIVKEQDEITVNAAEQGGISNG